jgi:cytidine deaminase
MEKITITASFTVYDSADSLPEPIRLLMQRAVAVRKTAYAPYSKFRVGAAIQLDNGEVVIGSNQENAAYPSGLCAERVAVFHAGAAYPDAKILSLAISAAADAKVVDTPIPPCGACRQVLAEYEMKQDTPMEIWFMGETGKVYKSDSLKNLLPLIFDKDQL